MRLLFFSLLLLLPQLLPVIAAFAPVPGSVRMAT